MPISCFPCENAVWFGIMKCFSFHPCNKKDEPKGMQSASGRSDSSAYVDVEGRGGGSELNSRDVSDSGSVESLRRNAPPNLSQRPSSLRVFTVSELKSATKSFSRSVMLGEGGFGCVYQGVIRSVDDPSRRIEVAVKQLSKRGVQVRCLLMLFCCYDVGTIGRTP